MKRIAALAVVSLAFLGACSSTNDKTPDATPSASESSTGTETGTNKNEREFTLADGTTVKFDRLGELPAEMTADIDARFAAVLVAPADDMDNFGAFKAEAAAIGTETGKYVGGVPEATLTCDDALPPSWVFAAQTMSTPFAPECGAADSKADAEKLATDYIANAVGGPDAWIVITQGAK